MAKLFNFYVTDSDNVGIDKTWYDSSNIKYSECIDRENETKTLKIVFTTGTQYQYYNVDVNDYLLFRESPSQGKALNRLIKEKKYEYQKLENASISELDEELFFRKGNGFFVSNEEKFIIKNQMDKIVYQKENVLNEEEYKTVIDILKSVGVNFKIVDKNE